MSQDCTAKWLICRICLKSDNKKLNNIFEPIAKDEIADLGTTLLDKIELCGGITLNQEHNLPNKICNQCVLLLRAAYKFRDLCQQSQHQLKQFVTNMSQKLESDETAATNIDSDAIEQTTTVQEDIGNEQLVEADYVIEEYDDTSYEGEPTLDDRRNDFITTIDVEGEEVHNFCNDENSQYVVEEVDAKGFNSEENDDEISTYKFEADPNGENIIMEEQPKEPKNGVTVKQTRERKKAVRRKRAHNELDTNGMYRCIFCNNCYTDKSKYNNHMKIHVNDKPHECEICNKRFTTTPQLSRHMNSHTGNRPYKCQFCEASFGDPSTKIKHERIHTNERPYKCCLCNKAFGYSNVLKVHMMTHTGEKPHTCTYCGKSFSQPHHKNAHEKRHTKVNMVIVQDSAGTEYMDEDDLKEYKIEEVI